MPEAPALVFGDLHLPRPLDVDHAVAWLTHLASEPGTTRLALEARADTSGIRYLLGAPAGALGRLRRQLSANMPGAQLVTGKTSERRQPVDAAARVRQHPTDLPLRTDAPDTTTRALLSSLATPLRPGEGLAVQVVLGRTRRPRTVPTHLHDPGQSLWSLLLDGQMQASTDTRTRIKRRLGQAGFSTAIRLGAASDEPKRRRRFILSLLGALATAQGAGVRLELARDLPRRLNEAHPPARWWPLPLSVEEIAVVLGWPYAEGDLPGLAPVHPRPLRAAANVHHGPRVFARSAVPGDGRLVGISAADQTLHGVAYGPSGSGKTNVLLHLIVADMTAGRPVVVLDPKRQLIDQVMARVPEHRVPDVVEINAADATPVGFNPLDVNGRDPDVVVDGILAAFEGVFADGYGPRTADIFSAALRTLARVSTADQPTTLVDLPRLLAEPEYRRPLVGQIQRDRALAGFWAWYESQSSAAQAEAIAAPLHRLRRLLLRPALARILDQPHSRFRMRDVFRGNKIVLVPLNEGLIGPGTASLLGSLIIADVWQATQERANVRQPRPGMVYVDEAPRFLNLPVSLADALAISRSLSVGWFLAAQFRSQFPPELRTAVDMNARSKVIFATEYDDARDAARLARDLVPEDFTALPRFYAYANLVADGAPSGWALVETLSPPPTTTDPEHVRAAVRAAYGPDPHPSDPDVGITARPSQQHPPGRVGRKQRQRRTP